MNANIRTILLAVSISGPLLGFVGWRVYSSRIQQVPHYEIVEDRSGSHPDGCSSLLGLAEQIMQKEPATSKSQLTILVIGDGTSANEPLRLAKYSIPRTSKAIEGLGANRRRQQELLADLLHKCQSLRSTTVSPIFLAIVEGLADLRAQGCAQNSGCKLYVDSDGEENVDRRIRKALSGAPKPPQILPTPANNNGIPVTFCGLAVTATGAIDASRPLTTLVRDPGREDRMQRTWQSLFTVPGLVNFKPYCPNTSTTDVYTVRSDAW